MLVRKINSLTDEYLRRETEDQEFVELDSTELDVDSMREAFKDMNAADAIRNLEENVMEVIRWPRKIAQNFGGTGSKKHHEYFNYIDVEETKEGNYIKYTSLLITRY